LARKWGTQPQQKKKRDSMDVLVKNRKKSSWAAGKHVPRPGKWWEKSQHVMCMRPYLNAPRLKAIRKRKTEDKPTDIEANQGNRKVIGKNDGTTMRGSSQSGRLGEKRGKGITGENGFRSGGKGRWKKTPHSLQ